MAEPGLDRSRDRHHDRDRRKTWLSLSVCFRPRWTVAARRPLSTLLGMIMKEEERVGIETNELKRREYVGRRRGAGREGEF